MATRRRRNDAGTVEATEYRHGEKRKNIPPAKMASEGKVPKVEKARYAYSPHLSPVLRFDETGRTDRVADSADRLLKKATLQPLSVDEARELQQMLSNLQPWLEWAGKREQHERGGFEVDPVALHIHERVSAQACIRAAMREDVQKGLFADPQQPYREAVQFYRHDVDWANRLILGDSLQVMSSLARRENLAGKVQMIYMDPPYGIKFASNFQPDVARKNVTDRENDLTREAETVRAYRDTWQIGLHSYLAYLRDRLLLIRDLLSESGSVFVQMGDENVHAVKTVMDEVFGPKNSVALIAFSKTGGQASGRLSSIVDYLIWYAKDSSQLKYRPLFLPKDRGGTGSGDYSWVQLQSGERRRITSMEDVNEQQIPDGAQFFIPDNLTSADVTSTGTFFYSQFGRSFFPKGGHWKTTSLGLDRLVAASRVIVQGVTLRYVRFLGDFPVTPLQNTWLDTGARGWFENKIYAVQTVQKVLERCILMTTDPGDLVLDPTCGSGTTAAVAEQWGRRWVTIDTSRVAIALTRQRLLGSKFDHFRTNAGPMSANMQAENPASGFKYRKVPHITLKSIAQNTDLDPILQKHEPLLDAALARCNEALALVPRDIRRSLASKLTEKRRREGARAVSDADRRRWLLPPENRELEAEAKECSTVDLSAPTWYDWEVPFDTDPDWPVELREAVTKYREAWRAKMDEVNAAIARNAEQEELVDQPEVVKGVVRVSGPFTVEGVRPEELSLGEEGLFDGTANEFETDPAEANAKLTNLHAYLTSMLQSLRNDGLTFLGNRRARFARLDPLFESAAGSILHAEGTWLNEDGSGNGAEASGAATVAVTFGPQYGPVTALQVEEAIRAAKRYDELVVAGFSFDAEASAVIEEASHPKLRIHAAYIRPDLNPAMKGLLKETPGSQLFTVFGQPDVSLKQDGEGEWVVTLEGVEIYDPVANSIRSTGAEKVAAWFLDQDFDGRCFCITQAFFPDQDAWEKIAKALKGSADPEAFEAFKGTESLPFKAGTHARIAVKVIDPRGNEVMAIRKLEG